MTTVSKIKILVLVLLASLSLAVIIQNTAPIEARILFVTIPIPVTVLIGGCLVVGYAMGLLTPVVWRRRQQQIGRLLPPEESRRTEAGPADRTP